MKQRILRHTAILVLMSVLLTFFAASLVMYGKFNSYMRDGCRDEAAYVRVGLEQSGTGFLTEAVGNVTASRITLADSDGTVLFDSLVAAESLPNHSDRPEFIQAKKKGRGESQRYSETYSEQTFYYAELLNDGKILRVARTTESFLHMMSSSFTLLGILVIFVMILELFLVQKRTDELIKPINTLNLEQPLENVCYEELRPLLVRVDNQNRQIAQQMQELEEADSMRREFSANVSHELKTPLMSISGYAELIMNGMVPPDKIREFSGRIYHEAERLSSLVADIIQLSKLDEKSKNLLFEAVDINELCEDMITHLNDSAVKKRITLCYHGETAGVRGVRHVLYEMFFNMTDNAIRYTPEGGTVTVTAGRKEGKAYFCVEDNGIGIPKNEQERIFERFYRVDKSHSRETGGTGLGLSIVKHGVSLHNASLKLDSEPGRGTKMELFF